MTKKSFRSFLSLLLTTVMLLPWVSIQAADTYLPFRLAYNGPGDFGAKVSEVKDALGNAGFDIVGNYKPYADAHIVIFTSKGLLANAAKTETGGFGAVLRASINKVGSEIQVAYVNPEYLAAGYRLDSDFKDVAATLGKALGNIEDFGSKELTKKKLGKYNYMMGMEKFNKPYRLGEYGSHDEAIAAVEKGLASNSTGIAKLYRLDIPGKQETIFGVSMKADTDSSELMDDKFQMDIVDFEPLRQNAYLPYEVMVTGNEVIALHMRFRMALHFPGLKMMGDHSFMKLKSSPGAIKKALKQAVGN